MTTMFAAAERDSDSSSEEGDGSSEEEDGPSDDEFIARMQAKLTGVSNPTLPGQPLASAAATAGAGEADNDSSSFQAFEGLRLSTGGFVSAGLLRAVVATLGPAAAPTPVQALVWRALAATARNDDDDDGGGLGLAPSATSGATDLLALSKTGSGKTVAFAVPVIAAVQALLLEAAGGENDYAAGQGATYEGSGWPAQPLALVLAPTRELCLQIGSVFEALLAHAAYGAAASGAPRPEVFCAVGGMHYGRQHAALRDRPRGPAVLVATAGRLLSLCGGVSASALARNPDAAAAAAAAATCAASALPRVLAPVPPAASARPLVPAAAPTSDFFALLASAGVLSNSAPPPPLLLLPPSPSLSPPDAEPRPSEGCAVRNRMHLLLEPKARLEKARDSNPQL